MLALRVSCRKEHVSYVYVLKHFFVVQKVPDARPFAITTIRVHVPIAPSLKLQVKRKSILSRNSLVGRKPRAIFTCGWQSGKGKLTELSSLPFYPLQVVGWQN